MPLNDFLNPMPAAPRTPEDHQTLKNSWRGFLQNPDTRAALIQFGINMLQPTGAGQDIFGQIGQSIGAAGETVAGRQQQRTEMANADLNRQIDIAGLGLRSEEMQRLREQGAADIGIRKSALGINEFEAETGRMNAETNRRNVGASGLTADQLVDARAKGLDLHQSALENFHLGLGPDPGDQATFLSNYEKALGVPSGNGTSSSATAAETGLPLVAAPPGPANAGPPVAAPEAKITSQQIQLTDPDRYNKLKAALTHPDPTTRKMAEELVRTYVSDADAFLQSVKAPNP